MYSKYKSELNTTNILKKLLRHKERKNSRAQKYISIIFLKSSIDSCTKTCPPLRWYSSAPADYYLKISNLFLTVVTQGNV